MPSFMPIGLKLWALEGYRQTDKQTDRQSYFNNIDIHMVTRTSKSTVSTVILISLIVQRKLSRCRFINENE